MSSEFNLAEAKRREVEGWARVPALLESINAPSFPKRTVQLTDFGGNGDGINDNRRAFESAITSLHSQGGGTIVVPQGNYLIDGPIVLKSNIRLEIWKDASLLFTSDPKSYLPVVKQRWEGVVCYNYSPLIYAIGETNLAITGEGTIDGQGAEWSRAWSRWQRPYKKTLRQMGHDLIPEDQRVFGNGLRDLEGYFEVDGATHRNDTGLRPPLIQFYECENILFEGVTIKNPPFWMVHPVFCKNVIARNLTLRGETANDDGFDPDSCENVLIEGCDISTWDDAISIKAGRDQDAWGRPGCKNVIIRNCVLRAHGANAICIGSEMSGGVENVFAENNRITHGGNAIQFKCNLDRGGCVKNVYIRGTTVEACRDELLSFTMKYHSHRGGYFPTDFNNVYVSDLTCKRVGRTAFDIEGVPDKPIRRVFINNIVVDEAACDKRLEDTEDILFNNVEIKALKPEAVTDE